MLTKHGEVRKIKGSKGKLIGRIKWGQGTLKYKLRVTRCELQDKRKRGQNTFNIKN